MIRVLLLVLLLGMSAFATVPWSGEELLADIPARHTMMFKQLGDLNNDGFKDAIAIARSWDEATNPNIARPILIFLSDTKGN